MDSDILILILTLIFVLPLSLFSKFKKVLAEQGDITLAPASVDADDEEIFFEEEEEEEEVSPYFTYEAEEVPEAPVSQPLRPVAAVRPVLQPAVVSEPYRFDLRQAVIGQIILENNYISEINQKKSIIS
jgi:hypothetical protein